MRIIIDLGPALRQFESQVAGAREKLPRVIADGLNEGGDKIRTVVRRSLRAQTGVKKAEAVNKRTDSKRAGTARLAYEIRGLGGGMPITDFPVRASAHGPVVATPWGRTHVFKRSFKTTGRGLLRARLGGGRFPIRSLRGPAVSKEIVKGDTLGAFNAQAAPMVQQMVVKRLGRLFG